MRVVIAGAGNVGRYLAADLLKRNHEVVIIEQRIEVVNKAKVGIDATWIHADACEPWVLEKAELNRSDVMVSATGDDEDNLVISLLSKQEFAVPRVVARVNHPRNAWLFDETWGVDTMMSPPHILASLVEEAVSVGDMVELLRLESGNVRLVEMTLPANAPFAGKHVYDLRLPRDASLVAIVRDGHVTIPEPETSLVAGDELIAIVAQDVQEALTQAILGG
ncbi:MAG: potassium channel family protein [Actinomycetota bacterium]